MKNTYCTELWESTMTIFICSREVYFNITIQDNTLTIQDNTGRYNTKLTCSVNIVHSSQISTRQLDLPILTTLIQISIISMTKAAIPIPIISLKRKPQRIIITASLF